MTTLSFAAEARRDFIARQMLGCSRLGTAQAQHQNQSVVLAIQLRTFMKGVNEQRPHTSDLRNIHSPIDGIPQLCATEEQFRCETRAIIRAGPWHADHG